MSNTTIKPATIGRIVHFYPNECTCKMCVDLGSRFEQKYFASIVTGLGCEVDGKQSIMLMVIPPVPFLDSERTMSLAVLHRSESPAGSCFWDYPSIV